MKKQTITTTEYTFTEEEYKIVKQCLIYCKHRLNNHFQSGITHALTKEQKEIFRSFNKFL